MKKKLILGILLFVLLLGAFGLWKFFGDSVRTPQKNYFYISTGENLQTVRQHLLDSQIINSTLWFDWASKAIGLENIKPGKYKINKGTSITGLVRQLKNGQQTPVNFVITKLRTREALAARIEKNFECDSASFIRYIESADSLAPFQLDSFTVMAAAMPYTYAINWTATPAQIFQQFYTAYDKFWTDERKAKAAALNLSPTQVVTLASIIDEETNAASDRPLIASVYLNRIKAGMPLQADPTLKYSMRNFGLKRLYNVHMQAPSPYNTYLNKGLPPGPICTPQLATIDAVLQSPATDYYYFVASPDFDGTHVFTKNYQDHLKEAKRYRDELDKRNIR